jgi:putative ABC transport system permease protein
VAPTSASLRASAAIVLGFTRGEISYILLAEVALLVVAAHCLGCLAGLGLTELIAWLLDTELFRIPVVTDRPPMVTPSS